MAVNNTYIRPPKAPVLPVAPVEYGQRYGNELTSALRQDIEKAVSDAGFMGRVALMEDATMHKGDVRVEWSEGGFKHSRLELDHIIDELIAAHQPPQEELSA